MNETMTTKEVAEVLRCSSRSVLRAFHKLYPSGIPAGQYSKETVVEITKYRTERASRNNNYKGIHIKSSVIQTRSRVGSEDTLNKAYNEGFKAGILFARENKL